MKRLALIVVLAALIAASSFSVALAKPAVPPPKDIEKAVFIHYKTPAKPDWAGPKEPKKEDEGYKLFRGGVKWSDKDLPVSYVINQASVPEGIDPIAAFNKIVAAFEEWDANTSKELYNDTVGTTGTAGAIKDGDNTIAWVFIDNSNIIARTTFWYYVNTKELIEFDIEFNTQFAWGIDPDGEDANYVLTEAMDIRNIATHESGHTLVLDDLYQDQYAQMTMYGYSDYGEVKKISLEPGDIAGLHKLYGE
jgi:hypothetical protein